ncbi:hypothetical protein CGRA01v4_15007 [Colletotrichum graminicola]|nr:hypothetical protein CGRA01v4_15007 [Colletotrichum graminicola]
MATECVAPAVSVQPAGRWASFSTEVDRQVEADVEDAVQLSCHWGRCKPRPGLGPLGEAEQWCRRLFVAQWGVASYIPVREVECRVRKRLDQFARGAGARAKIWGSSGMRDGAHQYIVMVVLEQPLVHVDLEMVDGSWCLFPQDLVGSPGDTVSHLYSVWAAPCDKLTRQEAVPGWILALKADRGSHLLFGTSLSASDFE